MFITYLSSVLIVLGALSIWIVVQGFARWFARRNPELGPAREEGEGCGFLCFCKNPAACSRRGKNDLANQAETASSSENPNRLE